jgi:phenylacetic acid degradation operon negative regulatory protein
VKQRRNTAAPVPSPGDPPLSARSVVASTLLGVDPPVLPGRLLVKAGELFGIAEGTTRVALSRLVAAGELEADDGQYRLVGPLLERQTRQSASRHPHVRRWSGDWLVAVVAADRRDAATRAALRDAARRLGLAELREGVWVRPDNLDPRRLPAARAVVEGQCRRFVGPLAGPDGHDGPDDAAGLAASLWDLDGWAARADGLRAELAALLPGLARDDTGVLAPAFLCSAAVLRHLLADPLLPDGLLPPHWPGAELRAEYDRYDAEFKRAWRAWFRAQH